jgi:hypothetical protein
VGQRLKLLDLETGLWHLMDADHIDHATWSRDSQYLYYHTESGPRRRRVRISDGQIDDLADLRDFPSSVYWWSDSRWTTLPCLLKDLGALELYALDLELPQ